MIPFGFVGGLQVRVIAVTCIDGTRDSTGPGTKMTGHYNSKYKIMKISKVYLIILISIQLVPKGPGSMQSESFKVLTLHLHVNCQ